MFSLSQFKLRQIVAGFVFLLLLSPFLSFVGNVTSSTVYAADPMSLVLTTTTPKPPPATLLPVKDSVFDVYTDASSSDNHFVPAGYIGDTGDIALEDASTESVHSGDTSIKVTYLPQGSSPQCNYTPPCKFAGVYWQTPPSNWATDPKGGYNLTGFKKVTFWARSDTPVKVEFKVGGITGDYPDTIQPARSSGLITLTPDWKPYEVKLTGADLGRVIGGFLWVADWKNNNVDPNNPQPLVFYLDDIRYERTAPSTLTPTARASATPAGKATSAATEASNKAFVVYDDQNSPDNQFVPSGYIGDTGDITLDEGASDSVHSGDTAIKVTYAPQGNNPQCSYTPPCKFAGVYWQPPTGNFGTIPNVGYNLTGFKKVTFWARSDTPVKVEFKVGGITGDYPDTIQPARSSGLITLTPDWKPYEIKLTGANLKYVVGGFLWVADWKNNSITSPGSKPLVFYLDDIRFEK